MRISYQDEPLFPGKPASVSGDRRLYQYYEHSEPGLTSGVHWFDFQTNAAHSLNVVYPASFYKMVLCIAGESRSVPKNSREYGFRSGHGLFYRTEETPYQASLPADTCFKVVHIHLSDAHIAMLERDAPFVFETQLPVLKLSAECADAFLQLKIISRENTALLPLLEEKLITDQLFNLAWQVLPRMVRPHVKDILHEAMWHIHRADRYLTIAELSKLTGTNTFRLKQVFREEMRTSVFQYQSDYRLELAAQLLCDTDLAISAVALQCGYESAAAFSNAFLRKYGTRPVKFKNSRPRK